MSLDRNQCLEEMGLSPQWLLRDQPSVARGAKPTPQADLQETLKEELKEAAKARVQETVLTEPAGQIAKASVMAAPEPVAVLPASGDRSELISRAGWDELRQSITDCRACGLCKQRKQVVPGVGDENADWLFIGEAPGAEEDAQGEPFVGVAGKLLDAMLAAIDLKRGENVSIANAVTCRPPENRNPEPSEMGFCAPYLKRQIELIQPKLIVLLGRVAVHAVLGEVGALGSLRGKTLSYRAEKASIPVVVTYHPAYLLRTLPDKAKSWEDLCRARALMRPMEAQ